MAPRSTIPAGGEQEDAVTSPNGNGTARGKDARDAGVPPVLPSIPLSREPVRRPEDQSIGELVKDVTGHLSRLVQAEIELARVELTSEVKKGVRGSIFFVVALTIVLFSLFFLFIALAELLVWLGLVSPAAYGIVFGIMLLTAGLFALLGYRKVRRIRKPERTISSLKESAQVLGQRGRGEPDGRSSNRSGDHRELGARSATTR
ncbi:MAG TPA: phage holin family protein [Pseudonocardia sp.]|jgi:uncharacterized membrane protein YqjE|nr:phage holin family protein [Pseudonocardia sp.]